MNRIDNNFNNWQWQLQNSVSCMDILHLIPVDRQLDFKVVEGGFPSNVTPYYKNLIDFTKIPHDPIFKQAFPDIRELEKLPISSGFDNEDPLNEEAQMPIPHLIHRYKDRVVLLVTNRCAVNCRFCLRKRKWKKNVACHSLNDDELSEVCAYLIKNPEIREVLVSGGDPLVLQTARLKEILLRISQISSVTILRLGTRIPVVLPMRINNELVEMLADIPGLWIATHFNHPRELTKEAIEACSKLIKSGIPIINQTVLLKEINDDVDTLRELFVSLTVNKIIPHYLFHIDPVKGNRHFATGIETGLNIMRSLRNQISSLATPQFAFDLPEGGGKIPLLPDYRIGDGYETIDGRIVEYQF